MKYWGFSVERDRLRERERQARAAMSVQAEQAAAGGGPDTRHHHHGHHNHAHHHANPHAVTAPLFRAPVRVSLRSDFILIFLSRSPLIDHRSTLRLSEATFPVRRGD